MTSWLFGYLLCLCTTFFVTQSAGATNPIGEPSLQLFEKKFLNVDPLISDLMCLTSNEGALPVDQLQAIVDYYEAKNKGIRSVAVGYLAQYGPLWHNGKILIESIKSSCLVRKESDLCLLEGLWGGHENALRVLAIFYDAKVVIDLPPTSIVKRMEHGFREYWPAYDGGRQIVFTKDELIAIEKAIRMLPKHLLKIVTGARLGELEDKYRIWIDGSYPLRIVPDLRKPRGLAKEDLKIISINRFFWEDSKDGDHEKSIDKIANRFSSNHHESRGPKYLRDFRTYVIFHEFAHLLDVYSDGDEHRSEIFNLSSKPIWKNLVESAPFVPYQLSPYDKNEFPASERFSDLFMMYMVFPERLKQTDAYVWLRDNLFNGIEYAGESLCKTPAMK